MEATRLSETAAESSVECVGFVRVVFLISRIYVVV